MSARIYPGLTSREIQWNRPFDLDEFIEQQETAKHEAELADQDEARALAAKRRGATLEAQANFAFYSGASEDVEF